MGRKDSNQTSKHKFYNAIFWNTLIFVFKQEMLVFICLKPIKDIKV